MKIDWLSWKWKRGFFFEKILSQKKKSQKRLKAAVLVDFENLDRSFEDLNFEKLGKFLDDMSFKEKKDIISFQVFVPTHLTSKAASLLYHFHNAEIAFIPQMKICPRNFITKSTGNGNRDVKDVDKVDWQISVQAMWLVDHCSVDEIVVVSNDYDFSWVRSYAKRHGIRFRLLPVSDIYSRDYLKAGGKEDILDFKL